MIIGEKHAYMHTLNNEDRSFKLWGIDGKRIENIELEFIAQEISKLLPRIIETVNARMDERKFEIQSYVVEDKL